MRENNTQLKSISNNPVPSTKLTDTSGNPSERYYWKQMEAVQSERQPEFWPPYVNAFERTLLDIMSMKRGGSFTHEHSRITR